MPRRTRSLVFACAACALAVPAWAGLQVTNVRMNPAARGVYAYPLQSPPVVGFQPFIAVRMTDARGPNDFDFYAIPAVNPIGNPLPVGNPYTFYATLDSGAQSHILSYNDYVNSGIEQANLDGTEYVTAVGASGQEDLLISDTLGIFMTGVQNLTSTNPPAGPGSNFVGQYRTSVLSAEAGSALPSVVGSPILAQFAVNIRNSQTTRFQTPAGMIRSPQVDFVPGGSGINHQYRMSVDLIDVNGAYTTEPFYFPSNFEEVRDNPSTPTNWTFAFGRANLANAGMTLNQQQLLFDTGAQVSVLSSETADLLGFDVEVDTPAFYVDVLGVGGTRQVPGFFLEHFELSVLGGTQIFNDVPFLVLDITDPRDGTGTVPGIIGMNLFNDRDLTIDLTSSQPFVRFSNPITPQWKTNAAGTWSVNGNWDLGSPDGVDVPANFLGAITAARTVTVDADFTVGSMKFDNANGYTLAGGGSITFGSLGRPSKIEVVQGSHSVATRVNFDARQTLHVAAGATLSLTGDTTSAASAVAKTGAGTLRLRNAVYESLAIDAGTTQLIAGGGPTDGNRVGSLSIAAGATLDLTDRPLAIDYDGASPLTDVRAHLAAGRIVGSVATPAQAIGYGEAATLALTSFGGIAIEGDAVVLKLTLKGDADLNGVVNFNDLLTLAQNYGQTSDRVWTTGDFDYDGGTTFDDLLALAQNYSGGGSLESADVSAAFAADWALAQSLVPEPTAALAIFALAAARRRRD